MTEIALALLVCSLVFLAGMLVGRTWAKGRGPHWTAERQLENLTVMVQGDHRWLSHDKTADALTSRYLAALSPDWYSRVHSDPCHFRRELGLEPVTAFSAINSPDNLARLARLAKGEPIYADGPLPERGWD